MARTKLPRVMLVLLAPLLASCFELQETIEIRPDASAQIMFELGIDATLYAFTKLDDNGESFCEPHQRGPEDYPLDSNIASSTVELKARDDDVFCIATYEIRDIRKFDASTLEDEGGFGGSPGIDDDSNLTIADEGDGTVTITQSFSSELGDPTRAGLDGSTDVSNEFGDSLLSGMFAGKNITITVRAPKILETNGDIDADGRELKWQLPVAELADDESKFEKVFRARIKYELSWWERLLP